MRHDDLSSRQYIRKPCWEPVCKAIHIGRVAGQPDHAGPPPRAQAQGDSQDSALHVRVRERRAQGPRAVGQVCVQAPAGRRRAPGEPSAHAAQAGHHGTPRASAAGGWRQRRVQAPFLLHNPDVFRFMVVESNIRLIFTRVMNKKPFFLKFRRRHLYTLPSS